MADPQLNAQIKSPAVRARGRGGSSAVARGRFPNAPAPVVRVRENKSANDQVASYLAREKALVSWIEQVCAGDTYLATHAYSDQDERGILSWLGNGVLLCKIANRVRENLVPRINMPAANGRIFDFKIRQNVQFFLLACEELGMERLTLFTFEDLSKRDDIPKILQCLEAFADVAADVCEEIQTLHNLKMKEFQKQNKLGNFISEKPPVAPRVVPRRPTVAPRNGTVVEDNESLLRACPATKRRSIRLAVEKQQNNYRRKSKHMEKLGLIPRSAGKDAENHAGSGARRPMPTPPAHTTFVSPAGRRHCPAAPPRSGRATYAPPIPVERPVNSLSNSIGREASEKTDRTLPIPPQRSKLQETTMPLGSISPDAERAVVKLQARVRARQSRRLVDQKLKREAHRDHVAHEILSTEESYVDGLQKLMSVYLKPLSTMKGFSKETVTAIKTIQGNVGIVVAYNSQLLNDLRPRVKDWSPHQRLGDVFLSLTHYMKSYTEYVNCYDQCLAQFQKEERQNRKFAEFLQQAVHQENLGQQDTLTLEQYLILPIQRIPRYLMLLTDLVKNTDEDHPDYETLTEALDKMSEVANYVNERKREAENLFRVMGIQNSIHGSFMDLVAPHRRFIEEFEWKASSGKGVYVLFLFNDVIIVTKPRSLMHIKAVVGGKEQRYVFKSLSSLAELYIISNVDASNANVIELSSKNDGDKAMCSIEAPSAQALKDFRRTVNTLKKELLRLRAKLKEVGADETTASALQIDSMTQRSRSREPKAKSPRMGRSPTAGRNGESSASTTSSSGSQLGVRGMSPAVGLASEDTKRLRKQRMLRRSRSLDLASFQKSLAGSGPWHRQPGTDSPKPSRSPMGSKIARLRGRGHGGFLSDHRSSIHQPSELLASWLVDSGLGPVVPALQKAGVENLSQLEKMTEAELAAIPGIGADLAKRVVAETVRLKGTSKPIPAPRQAAESPLRASDGAHVQRYNSQLFPPNKKKGFRALISQSKKRWESTPHMNQPDS